MEINEAELKKLEGTITQVKKEEEQETQKASTETLEKMDLAPIKPMIHRLHCIGIDMLGYEPDDKLIKGLDDEAIALIEYYAPVLSERYVRIFGYLGTWGLVLAMSKKKGERAKISSGKEEVNLTNFENIENVQ
jgi:hypothetical protein